MNINYNSITFSVFFFDSLESFKNVVTEIFKREFCEKRAYIKEEELKISDFYNPYVGGNHDDVFCFWKSSNYKNRIFFISNSSDGRYTLCNVIHEKLGCEYLSCSLSNEKEYPFYCFHYTFASGEERVVMAYKEDKWVFYTKGSLLDIEDERLYKRRSIKDRLNNDIIISYLKKLNIDISLIDCDVEKIYKCEIKLRR